MKCKREIAADDLRESVRLQNGQMHGACHRAYRQYVDDAFAAAIREGRYVPPVWPTCGVCGSDVYDVHPERGEVNGKPVCRRCDERMEAEGEDVDVT